MKSGRSSPQLCPITFPIRGANDRLLRQLETVCARDYDLSELLTVLLDSMRTTWATLSIAAQSDQLVYNNFPLHLGASQRRPSRSGTLLSVPQRSVERRPNVSQKPGSDQSTTSVAGSLLSPTLQKENTSPPTSCHTVCTTNADSYPAKRGSWQAACKQSLRSSKQHRTFLDLPISGHGQTWWTRRRAAAPHIPLKDLSHAVVSLLAGWMAAKIICGILFFFLKMVWLCTPISTVWLAHILFPSLSFLPSNQNQRRFTLHCPNRKACVLYLLFVSRMLRNGKNQAGMRRTILFTSQPACRHY